MEGVGTELMRVLFVEIDELKVDSFLTVYTENPLEITFYKPEFDRIKPLLSP